VPRAACLYDYVTGPTSGQRESHQHRLSTKENAPSKRIAWVYSILPVNVALGPIGTFVSLSLLQSGGVSMGTVYVSLAATLFNAVSAMSNVGFSAAPVSSQKSVMYAYCAIILVARMAPLMILWWMAETTGDAELAIG